MRLCLTLYTVCLHKTFPTVERQTAVRFKCNTIVSCVSLSAILVEYFTESSLPPTHLSLCILTMSTCVKLTVRFMHKATRNTVVTPTQDY